MKPESLSLCSIWLLKVMCVRVYSRVSDIKPLIVLTAFGPESNPLS